ncbi:GntR family transcriptional regulator [Roseitranquillus sediminis]|uniref:GntR family transcriptional regulator n=1 Tax=Roseitranquillus sediminis TaxID=2809051 RepID=UPI001D0C7686|nr:GntR family transcriptional regulator [Roseitranquillus sediminis]MBM9595410.1 GntR family transcriptional regulator [Roseitranquillus sediminis]
MSISETVYLELRRRLMAGHYEPGLQLREEAVAQELGVSRTPVRSAIERLMAEGLLEPGPKRGARITEWRKEEAEDIFRLRSLIEGYAASLAAEKIERESIDEMDSLNRRIADAVAGKRKGYLDVVHEANLRFHQIIYESCGNAQLRQFGWKLLEFPMVIGGFYIYSDADMAESVRQHEEIVAGLRARSPDWAKAAMTCHLTAAVERFRRSQKTDGSVEARGTGEDGVAHASGSADAEHPQSPKY